jgi:hypothetical protein
MPVKGARCVPSSPSHSTSKSWGQHHHQESLHLVQVPAFPSLGEGHLLEYQKEPLPHLPWKLLVVKLASTFKLLIQLSEEELDVQTQKVCRLRRWHTPR